MNKDEADQIVALLDEANQALVQANETLERVLALGREALA